MEEKMENYIQLKEKKDIFILGIKDENGKVVYKDGKPVTIEFDLGDIELPIRYQKCAEDCKNIKRKALLDMQVIDKQRNLKTNQIIERKNKIIVQFYKDMIKNMDLFLGENGTSKFLNGRKPYWEMFEDLNEALQPFLPKMKLTLDDMKDRIRNKYSKNESDVLKDD